MEKEKKRGIYSHPGHLTLHSAYTSIKKMIKIAQEKENASVYQQENNSEEGMQKNTTVH